MMIAAAAPVEIEDVPPPRPATLSIVYLVAVAIASLVGMLFAIGVHVELLSPTARLMSADAFAQLVLLRDAWFALAVTLPGAIALGHLLIPTTRSLVVERLERLALAGFTVGGAALLVASLASGWMSLGGVAVAGALVCAAAIAQSVAFVLRLRAARPRGSEASPFARAFGAAAGAALVALPVSAAMFAVLFVERVAHVAVWRDAGGDPIVFSHALELALRPVAYLAVVPCIGAVGEVLGLRARSVTIAAVAMLLLGGVAWAARLFGGDGAAAAAVTSFFSLALLVPAAVVVVEQLGAIRRAHERDGAFWLAVAAVVLFVELGLSAPPLAMADVSASVGANAFASAHHELLLAVLGFAVAATLHRAWPRLGAPPSQTLARVGALTAFVGVEVGVAAQAVAGLNGMPATIDYPEPLRPWAMTSGAGWLLVAAGAAILGANLLMTLRRQASSA